MRPIKPLPSTSSSREGSVGSQPEGSLVNAVCDAVFASNQQLLEALAISARIRSGAFPLPEMLREQFGTLTEADRRRAAQCGVLLADAGFSDVDRWRAIARQAERYSISNDAREWLSSEDSVVLAYSILMVAWYLVHTTPRAAGVILGMSDSVIQEYRSIGVGQLALIATRRPHWIRPRWINRPDVWLDLIERCTQSDETSASHLTLRCLSANAACSSRLRASMEARPAK